MTRPRIAALCVALILAAPAAGRAEEACPTSRMPPVSLPSTRKRLASNSEVLIVTLGSSSTEGWMATSPAHTYPARLQSDLSASFPFAHIAVVNRGIGGQDALEEVARLDSDALAVRPDLVIWQVGANGAMTHSDPAVFRKLVATGVERLQSLKIDVVLMDNQRSPMILASPEHGVLEQALADIAIKYNVSLFSRGTLMDGWKREGLPYEHFLANDYVHMNDLGYQCLADALAGSMEEGLGKSPARSTIAVAHMN